MTYDFLWGNGKFLPGSLGGNPLETKVVFKRHIK